MINFNTTSADSLQKKSDKILGVFSKTKEELATLQSQQEAYSQAVAEKISELKEEKDRNDQAITKTNSILKKIEEFLS